ncbi:MAG: G1 family glutamic endopeptidase, partial [Terriglobales bacterium]
KLAALAASVSILLSFTAFATAESDAVRAIRASAATVPTNIAGIHTYAEPPKGFNPVAASDVELATYGFPPRPDKQANPDRYELWERAMKAAKIRWNGELKVLSSGGQELISSGSSQLAEAVRPETGPSQLSSTNASGVVLSNTQTAWSSTKSFDLILAEFSIPVTQFPFNSNCSQDYANEFTFVGIDDSFYVGANNAEVFQPGMVGGIQTAVWCNPNQTTYQAAFGWAPSALLATFAVDPGDVVWADLQILDANDGYAYLEDLMTGTLESYAISTCEAGVCTNLRGRTAAWTVSRGCCEGPGPNGEWPLANTTHIFVGIGEAENGTGKLFWPGSQSPSLAEVLYMLDDGLDQSIETVSQGSSGPEGSGALLFSTTGCAQSGGCTP